MELTEQFILRQAPNAAAAENGRRLSKKGSFSQPRRTEDGSLYWADCAGSGKAPYRTSIDFTDRESPVCRCSCPSRQFPCKHSLGLMFEILSGKDFLPAEIPDDLAEKRMRQAARAAKKGASGPARERKPNAAAQTKRLGAQLKGLDMAERMVDDLLSAGVGTLAGASAQTYEKLAKDLGSYYLTGPQTAFSRMALAARAIQRGQMPAEEGYAEVLRVLIALHATIQKSRAFLRQKLEAGQYSAEDTVLFEALGGVWRLEDLRAIGAYRENARLVQLSFDVSLDEAKREYVERGWWLDLDTGRVDQTLNLRPLKAAKHVKADDSRFELLEVPTLYTYPGEGNCRVRWDGCVSRPLTAEEQAGLPALAQKDLGAAVKLAKGQMKNTLLPKFYAALVPVGRIGLVGEAMVLEDGGGARVVLKDRAEDGAGHASAARLAMLPEPIPAGSALFGLLFYDNASRSICLHPYSIVTRSKILRLLY